MFYSLGKEVAVKQLNLTGTQETFPNTGTLTLLTGLDLLETSWVQHDNVTAQSLAHDVTSRTPDQM